MLELWGDWVTNGWDRPDDDLQYALELTDEEQRRGIAEGRKRQKAQDDAMGDPS
jgi:hypothetical protein